MATATKGPDTPDASSTQSASTRTASPPPPGIPGSQALLNVPVVYRSRGNKRRKQRRNGRKRYSRSTKGAQRFFFGLSRAAYRTARACSTGLDTYTARSNKSMRRKRDGMVKDVLRNASRGFADAAEEFGKAPGEIARRVSTKTVRRTFRFLTPIRIS